MKSSFLKAIPAILVLLPSCSDDTSSPAHDSKAAADSRRDTGSSTSDRSSGDRGGALDLARNEGKPGADTGGGQCSASWKPTTCGDCQGSGSGSNCYQDCIKCGDGKTYRAECDGTAGTCKCLLDGVQICTCKSKNPVSSLQCQPEEWGGANCCWNVG
jgi:hypothetical protein